MSDASRKVYVTIDLNVKRLPDSKVIEFDAALNELLTDQFGGEIATDLAQLFGLPLTSIEVTGFDVDTKDAG